MKTITLSADRLTIAGDFGTFAGRSTPWDPDDTSGTPTRPLHDPSKVVYSTNKDGSQGQPYMPARYPSGTWNVTGVQTNDETARPDLGKMVILTDAHQTRTIWALDANGGYDHDTGVPIEDYGYEMHHDAQRADGDFTLGCEHIESDDDAVTLGEAVAAVLNSPEGGQQLAAFLADMTGTLTSPVQVVAA